MGYAQCVVPHLKAQGDAQITLRSTADLPGQNHVHELVGERVSVHIAARNRIGRTVHQLHLPRYIEYASTPRCSAFCLSIPPRSTNNVTM